MVDLHKGFEGFEKLVPEKGKTPDEPMALSREGEERPTLHPGGMATSEEFYNTALAAVKDIFDKVRAGLEKDIDPRAFLKVASDMVEKMSGGMERDDLVKLVFSNDDFAENYLYTHSVNVCLICARIGLEMNYSRDLMKDLVVASLLHDVGMMKVSLGVWNKGGRLSEKEYGEVKKHSLYGEEITRALSGVGDITPVIVGQHQERCDGSGYPKGLTKDDIHYLARLVSLADSYEALTHTRKWRARYQPDKSIQKMLDEESSGYDPHFLKAILRHISIFPVGSWVKISTGDVGEVIKTNKDTPMRPVIRVTYDRNQKRLPGPRLIDLSKQLLIHVEKCVETSEPSAGGMTTGLPYADNGAGGNI